MRLRRMTMKNVGPFIGLHHIDFDTLSEFGTFVLAGPTGSGKSIILDSIAYALYGKPLRATNAQSLIRSSFAPDTEATEVTLAFTINSKDYAIRRCPSYFRQRKTGEGLTKENGSVVLLELEKGAIESNKLDQGTPLETKEREVNARIINLIGLDGKQFGQTMILPQGEFTQFLKASSQDKKELLEKIFDTESYAKVAARLKEKRKEANDELNKARQNFDKAVEALKALLDLDDFTATTISEAISAVDSYADSADNLIVLLDNATRAAQEQAKSFEDEAQAAEKTDKELEKIADALRKADTAYQKLTEAEEQCSSLNIPLSEATLKGYQEHRTALLQEIGQLETLAEREKQLEDEHRKLDALREKQEEIAHEIESNAAELAALPQVIQTLESQHEQKQSLANKASEAQKDLEAAKEQIARFDKLREKQTAFQQADEENNRAAQQLEDTKETYLDVFRRWAASTSARLAKELAKEPSTPCPVCGSTEHPILAQDDGSGATDEELKQAQEAREAAEKAAKDASQEYSAAKGAYETLENELSGFTLDETAAAHKRAQKAIAEAEKAKQAAEELRAQLEEKRKNLDNAQMHDKNLQMEQARVDTKITNIEESICAAKKQIDKERGEYESIAARITAAREKAEEDQKAIDAITYYKNCQTHHIEAENEYKKLLDESAIETTSSKASVLALAESAKREAKQKRTKADQASQTAEKSSEQNTAVHNKQEDWKKLESEKQPLIRLANLVNGDNIQRFSLSSYVLFERFERTVNRANEHIASIYNNRYRLMRKVEKEKGRAMGGLNLEILDTYADPDKPDRIRPIDTSSGGESFFIALSLALALADIVQSENGGIQLDTLMIDEGFGTLSPDILDGVIDILNTLSEHRLVGAISHVESLKEAIPNQLVITKNGDGTSHFTINPDANLPNP